MGAGILPTCIHNGKLYFLFGKEHAYCDTPGWSDFGGGTDNSETYLQTAIREGGEELTGFLGNKSELSKMLKCVYSIDYNNEKHGIYRMHIFNLSYNQDLPYYYNNNQRFIQTHLSKDIIKKSKIFEKAEIKWVCVDSLKKMRPSFRSYFKNIVDLIEQQKNDIYTFIKNKNKNKNKNKTRSNKTRSNKTYKNN
jgi:hypothetical protein